MRRNRMQRENRIDQSMIVELPTNDHGDTQKWHISHVFESSEAFGQFCTHQIVHCGHPADFQQLIELYLRTN